MGFLLTLLFLICLFGPVYYQDKIRQHEDEAYKQGRKDALKEKESAKA